jgi:predicted RNase H-like HicB family nuclease
MKQMEIIIEKHPDGYVAYPLGVKGVVVGQGDTYEEALADVKSAIEFHLETFGPEVLCEADATTDGNNEREGDSFVALCPELGIANQGRSAEGARGTI